MGSNYIKGHKFYNKVINETKTNLHNCLGEWKTQFKFRD